MGRETQTIHSEKQLLTERIDYVVYPILNKLCHMKTEVTDGNSVQSIKPQPTYFDLFQPRSLKTEIQAVVDQGAHFGVVAIVAHTNDGNLRVSDQSNQLL